MKKFSIIVVAFSLLLFSNFALASVHGMWNMERIEKSSIKIGKAKPIIEIENISDVWIFHDDGSFKLKPDATSPIVLLSGTWTQKGKSVSVVIPDEQMAALIEALLLEDGITATATIQKSRISGSEKKDWTLKGKYQVKADIVLPDLSTAKLSITGSFTGTPPLNTAEYYPLGQDDTWTYREVEQEGAEIEEDIETYTIMGTETIKGKLAAKKVQMSNGEYELTTNTSGVQFYQDYETDIEDDGSTLETIDTYNPPIMYVPPRLSVGTRHSFKSTLTHKESTGAKITAKITGETVVEGMEDVTVAAGTFQNCVRIQVTTQIVVSKLQIEEYMQATLWFANGVGLVKEESFETAYQGGVLVEEDSENSELLSATVGGISYP